MARVADPSAELHAGYSSPGARATSWAEASRRLADAEIYWLSTVRGDGRPHVTPLLSVQLDGAMHVCTGPTERKARNLAANPHCVLTTGCNELDRGLDVVLEGRAVRVLDDARLRALADAFELKYGPDWRYAVHDGAFHHDAGGEAWVFRIEPATAFAFAKGEFGQTRYRFDSDSIAHPPAGEGRTR